MSTESVVIVGTGAAGTAAATQLRNLGYAGDLTLVNAEAQAPYNRTTVNKILLHPDSTLDAVHTSIPDDPHTTLLAGRAERLDTERRTVILRNGNHLSYDAVNRPGMSGELIRWKDHSHGTSLEVPDRAA